MSNDVDALAARITGGDRRALAQAITLVESTRADHRSEAIRLLDLILPHTGNSTRVGVSGAPGVGKSTFIEAFGLHGIDQGRSIAVLAVDPSSVRSGGSIMGDKTRMEALAKHPNAFIRPTPAGGTRGGVARRTREAMLLCEAAGFDMVMVETVGVGQSETEVDNMVDVFLLLVAPGAGDELQGIKRGVMELADLLVISKADGDLLPQARETAAEYGRALHLLRPKHSGWDPPVVLCSAHTRQGIGDVDDTVHRLSEMLTDSEALPARRAAQATAWLWTEVTDELLARFRRSPVVKAELDRLEAAVASGRLAPSTAAAQLLRNTDRGPLIPGASEIHQGDSR